MIFVSPFFFYQGILKKYNIAMENGPGLKMYFLLNMVIFQPAMLVYQRVVNLKFVGVGHQLNNLPKKLVSTMRKKMFVLFLSQFEQLKVAIAHVKKIKTIQGGWVYHKHTSISNFLSPIVNLPIRWHGSDQDMICLLKKYDFFGIVSQDLR